LWLFPFHIDLDPNPTHHPDPKAPSAHHLLDVLEHLRKIVFEAAFKSSFLKGGFLSGEKDSPFKDFIVHGVQDPRYLPVGESKLEDFWICQ
jgi:hypothetical protein